LREGYESDDNTAPSEAQGGANAQQIPGQPGYARQAGDFFSWVEAHPHLPSVLSTWFQLLVNSLLGLSFLYVIYIIYSGVQADVNIEASKYEAEALRDISLCHKQYTENRCDPATRVPAMEHACGNWYACMNRDPKQIAKASVTARTFANIFNSFVQEFSYKSMVCFTFFLITWLFVSRELRSRPKADPSSEHLHSPNSQRESPSRRADTINQSPLYNAHDFDSADRMIE
jgi:hypothetical protein